MVQKIIKENIFLILSVALTILAILPLFHSGLFPMHDNEQVGRLFDLDQALRAGQFPVRIIQDFGFGYGYLLFNFYPPFVYYFGEVFRLLHFSYIDSIKIVMGAGFILSAIFMYLFAKELFGKVGGLVASVFYTYAPYHSVDIYVRGALPEFFSFVFIPAIFWSYLKLSQNNSKKYVVTAAVFNFLLVITHNLVALMGSVFIGGYIIFLLYSQKSKKKFALNVSLTIVFSLLLSSFFIIPALLENKYTMVSLLTTQLANYNIHFVCLSQLWNSPWGYGGSAAGCVDGLSFKIGKLHVILSALAFVLATIFIYKKKLKPVIFLFSAMLLLSVFMQLSYSKFIWDHISPLAYIQFPWRYLLFTAFFSSLLVGSIPSFIKDRRIISVIAVILISYLLFQSRLIFVPQTYLNNQDSDYTNLSTIRWTTSQMSFEYTPIGIAIKNSRVGNSVVAINQSQIAKTVFSAPQGDLSGQVLKNIPQEKIIKVNVQKPSILTLNEYAYPGWEVLVDNKQVNFTDNNKLKLININLNTGEHVIDAKFEDTNLRKVSNILSLVGVFSILSYLLFYKKNEKT